MCVSVHWPAQDMRAIGVSCANEAEFQGYYVVSAADPEVLSGRLCQLPPSVLCNRRIQRALRVVFASTRSNSRTPRFAPPTMCHLRVPFA